MIKSLMIPFPCVGERDMKYEKSFLALFIFTKSIQGRKILTTLSIPPPTNSHPPPPPQKPSKPTPTSPPTSSASSPNPFKKHSDKKSTHHPPPTSLSYASPAVEKSRESFRSFFKRAWGLSFDCVCGPGFCLFIIRCCCCYVRIPPSSSSLAPPPGASFSFTPFPSSSRSPSVTMPLSPPLTSLSLINSSEQNLSKSLMGEERKKEAGEGTRREDGDGKTEGTGQMRERGVGE